MINVIIICVLIVLGIIGIRSSARHFKGEGGCCGGSTVKVRKKKLKQVDRQRIFVVDGITCNHCKNRIESRLNCLDGVSAKVNVKKKTVEVLMEKQVEEEEVIETIEKAGYEVTDIL